jgi:hypothetical protein
MSSSVIEWSTTTVKRFVAFEWTDQKLAEVLAFAEDGKMGFWRPCNCLIGVHGSANLHRSCQDAHYARSKRINPRLQTVETAYRCLGLKTDSSWIARNSIRQRRFIAILHEVIADRDAKARTRRLVCANAEKLLTTLDR